MPFFKNKAESINEINSFFEKNRDNYLKKIEDIESGNNNNPTAKFHKFAYLFHDSVGSFLKVRESSTMDELVDEIKDLSSKNYSLTKKIKDKEDMLLNEKDKEKFNKINNELKILYYDKDYFSALENNICKHALVSELKEIVDLLNWMEYSGDEITEDDLRKVLRKSTRLVRSISEKQKDISRDKDDYVVDKLKIDKNKKDDLPPPKKKDVQENSTEPEKKESELKNNQKPEAKPVIKNLFPEEKEFIKKKVGEKYFSSYFVPIISFMEKFTEGYEKLPFIKESLIKNKWPEKHVEYVVSLIKLVIDHRQ